MRYRVAGIDEVWPHELAPFRRDGLDDVLMSSV
jgi:hypothetical protein